jgi:hypothetical protein
MACTLLAGESRTIAPSPGTSPRGHFAGMATRSLHARGGGASGDNYRMAEVGGVALP